eukprot:5067256-Alexandrium_andersonii.AAC.1
MGKAELQQQRRGREGGLAPKKRRLRGKQRADELAGLEADMEDALQVGPPGPEAATAGSCSEPSEDEDRAPAEPAQAPVASRALSRSAVD